MKEEVRGFLTGILLLSTIIILTGNAYIEIEDKHNVCIEEGYEFYADSSEARDGYIVCCIQLYETNIKADQLCEGVKYEGSN